MRILTSQLNPLFSFFRYDSSCPINPISPTDPVKAPFEDNTYGVLNDYRLTRGGSACTDQTTRFMCPLSTGGDFGNYPNGASLIAELKGDGSATSVIVDFVHISYNGGAMYFTSSNTFAEVNAALPANTRLLAYTYPDPQAEDVMGGPALGGFADATDLRDVPFYSPSLGSYCNDVDGECYFMSWVSKACIIVLKGSQ